MSANVTINVVLPTLTSIAAQQRPDRISPPFNCPHVFPANFWWFHNHGCSTGAVSDTGISFIAHVNADPFISDPTQSGVKYVQAVSAFRKFVSRGVRCWTHRVAESDVTSGWQRDTNDPYGLTSYSDFSGLLTSIGIDTNDSPGHPLTGFTDFNFVDAVYADDRFEMYIVYYSGTDPAHPPIQRPLGKLTWNWGGLVVFDWNGTDAVHHIRSTNPTLLTPTSTFPPQGIVTTDDVPCPGGPPFTDNRIDSSREFVKYHYIDFLGRDPNGDATHQPDLVGWNFWTSGISQCVFDLNCTHAQRVQTGLAFFYSGEFIGTDPDLANPPGSPGFNAPVYNRAFVKYCYLKYMHRNPFDDPNGWDFWTNDLNSTGNYGHMIDAFISSTEYRGRPFS
jgi:hypothetical protein